MGSMKGIALTASLGVLALGASAARADSPCDRGYRDTTAAERATMTRILESVRQVLPPAPEGWVVVNDDPPSVPGSLCMDYERKPWSYGYSRTYRRTDRNEEIDRVTRAAADLMQADMAKKQPRLDAIMAKSEALTRQQIALIQKGEMEKAVAFNEQLAALQEEYRKVSDEGDARARGEAMMIEAMRDIEFSVSVSVNPWGESPADADTTAITVAGKPVTAYRWNSRSEDSHQGGALVVYGLWRTTTSGSLGLVARGQVPANAVHGLSVRVDADEDRLPSVIEAIDFAALEKLVPP